MDLLLSSETARLLNVSTATVHQWERAGRLSALKTSHGVRLFARADVLRLKAERDRERQARDAVVKDAPKDEAL